MTTSPTLPDVFEAEAHGTPWGHIPVQSDRQDDVSDPEVLEGAYTTAYEEAKRLRHQWRLERTAHDHTMAKLKTTENALETLKQWQRIETKFPNQSPSREIGAVLAVDAATGVQKVSFMGQYGMSDPDDHYYSEADEWNPTHWMTLPPNPTEAAPASTGQDRSLPTHEPEVLQARKRFEKLLHPLCHAIVDVKV